MAFLNSGIMAMLSSRLGREGAVEVITAPLEAGNDAAARAKAQELQADYLLTGNLTIFGNAVSTDASFLDVKAGTVAVKFDEYGQNSGDVLAHIDKFADRINEKVLNPPAGTQTNATTALTAPALKPEPSSSPTPPPPAAQPGAKATAVTEAPVVAPTTKSLTAAAPSEAATSSATTTPARALNPIEKPIIWKSGLFKLEMEGLAVDDVDGDGRNEIVFIDSHRVHIYRYTNGNLEKVFVFKTAPNLMLLSLDTADLNHNGSAEIFITALSNRGRLNSFVLEWNGSIFDTIIQDSSWYLRVLKVPDGNPMLLGQKRGIVSAGDTFDAVDGQGNLFLPGIFHLVWNNGTLEGSEQLDLPQAVGIFGFTMGDIFNDGRKRIVALSDDRYLRIYDPDGALQWESGERYGGSTRFLEYPAMSGKDMDRYYLPQRIHLTDVDRDGQNELVVVENDDLSGGFLGRVRAFKSGKVEILAWNQVVLQQRWQTDTLAGYISDYVPADMDGDGNNELVMAVVSKGGTFTGKKSYLVAYTIK
jgi:hypothetical protein